MNERLPNHLRAHRKRAGLSQRDVAYLLGSHHGAKVSRYERFLREPSLRAIVAYEAIFAVPARDLFPGIHDAVAVQVQRRAKLLARRLMARQRNPRLAVRIGTLHAIAAPPPEMSYEPCPEA